MEGGDDLCKYSKQSHIYQQQQIGLTAEVSL